MENLTGRNAIITGASQGLGAEIARQYVVSGASVILSARTENDLKTIKNRLEPSLQNGQHIEVIVCDVSCTSDVDRLIAQSLQLLGHIDILVNNAGVYGPIGMIDQINWEDWKRAIEINLYGTVYPCSAIFPHYKERCYGKIINLSGGGATNPLPRLSAYAASKAAVVRLTETLAYEGMDYNIDVNAVAPGTLKTRLMTELLDTPPKRVGEDFYKKMKNISRQGGTPLQQGANLCKWLGSANSDGITGKLISAVWDPWTDLQNYRNDLDKSDLFTLRRIVPEDRGLTWGK